MIGFRIAATIGAFAVASLAFAQAPAPAADPGKAAPKKAVAAEAKKDTAAKDKAPVKKPAPKKPAKKPAPKTEKSTTITPGGGTIEKMPASQAPTLRDSKGNTIPTSPDAYDVSSATKKK